MAVTNTITIQMGDIEDYGNSTYDGDNYTDEVYSCDDQEESLQKFDAVFKSVLYSLIFLLGVAGNGLMITVLLRRRRLLRITEIYLLHLAVADLMLLLTFPFNIGDSIAGWLFGEFLCKLMGLITNLNLLCGSFLLACIGFDRYLAIVRAVPSMRSRRPKTVHLTCIILWLICLGLSLPNIVFLTVKVDSTDKLSCSVHDYHIHGHNWVLANRVLNHVCFFLPLAVMSYCNTAVAVTLCKSQKSKTKQGAIRLVLIITLIFCFCWLPYNITLLIQTMIDLYVMSHDSCESKSLQTGALEVTLSLGLSHCCLNPFLYAFVGVQFRNDLNKLLWELGCNLVCLPFPRSQGHSRPSTSDGTTTVSLNFTL